MNTPANVESLLQQCEDYVNEHDIMSLIRQSLHHLCIHQPDDPVHFLKQYFANEQYHQVRSTSDASAHRTIVPLVSVQNPSVTENEQVQYPSLVKKRRGAVSSKSSSGTHGSAPFAREIVQKDYATMCALSEAIKKNILFR